MVYTESKTEKGHTYYYRTVSIRDNGKIRKRRVYLGSDLSKTELNRKEEAADMELIFLKSVLLDSELKELDSIQKEYLSQPKENERNRYEVFCSLFTYDSTNIEGNTLTLRQTAMLLFENQAPSSKSMREINETINHKDAFDFMLGYKGDINRNFILELHKRVIKNTLRKEFEGQAGSYRKVQVFIRGAKIIPPKPGEVTNEMKSLLSWYSKNKGKFHPLVTAAYFHAAFEAIHPFIDGNGRVGRLLINFILHKNSYPMINIPSKNKHVYYKHLQQAQEGNLRPFAIFLLNLMKKEYMRF